MAYAIAEDRIVVSADTDFGTVLALHSLAKPSFVLFRRSDKRPQSVLMQLVANLKQIEEALDEGAVVVMEDKRIRIRDCPSMRKDDRRGGPMRSSLLGGSDGG